MIQWKESTRREIFKQVMHFSEATVRSTRLQVPSFERCQGRKRGKEYTGKVIQGGSGPVQVAICWTMVRAKRLWQDPRKRSKIGVKMSWPDAKRPISLSLYPFKPRSARFQ